MKRSAYQISVRSSPELKTAVRFATALLLLCAGLCLFSCTGIHYSRKTMPVDKFSCETRYWNAYEQSPFGKTAVYLAAWCSLEPFLMKPVIDGASVMFWHGETLAPEAHGGRFLSTNISNRFSLSFQFRFILYGIAGTASTHSFRKSPQLRKNTEIQSRDREKMKQKRREVARRSGRRLRASHPSVFAALVRRRAQITCASMPLRCAAQTQSGTEGKKGLFKKIVRTKK